MRINVESSPIDGYDNLSLVNDKMLKCDWRKSPPLMPDEYLEEIRSETVVNMLPKSDLTDFLTSWYPKLNKNGRLVLGYINFNFLFTLAAHRKIDLQSMHNILMGNIFGRCLHKNIEEIKETIVNSGFQIEQISIDALLGTIIARKA